MKYTKYVVHRKPLGEYESDVAGAALYGQAEEERGKLAPLFMLNGKIAKDINDIDDDRLVNQLKRREWQREDFDTEMEYMVASTTMTLMPLQHMAYFLATYETGIKKKGEMDSVFTFLIPLRLYLIAEVQATLPLDVWIEVSPRAHGWGAVKGIHGWRKKPRGGKR
jgi:hypothetical protein